MTCSLCTLATTLLAPKAEGSLQLDHEALRRELGSRTEILDALPTKAAGRPSANAAVMWRYFTTSVYQSGDLPLLATREALQNSVDAIKAAIRQRQIQVEEGRFEVSWEASSRSLSWEDNGIGMDADMILGKFLVIGESGKRDAGSSEEAAGGFGVAKAVILGASATFRWEMHTRDNLAVGNGTSTDVEIFDAPKQQGTRITIHDVSEDFDAVWDRARQAYIPMENRIRELLAANDLPEITLIFNGTEVRPLFSRRGGSKVSLNGNWGTGTTAQVKAYRRAPGDRGGAYYLRLNGLFQFKMPSQRGGLKVDVVVDLNTTVRPGQSGYPLNAARDALQDQARWTFSDLVDEVEKENESTGRSEEEEVYDPDSDDPREGAAELNDLVANAFADQDFQKVLQAAAGGIMDFYAERLKVADKEEPIASAAPRGSKGEVDFEHLLQRPAVLPPGFKAATINVPVEPDIAQPSPTMAGPATAEAIRNFLEVAGTQTGNQENPVLSSNIQQALQAVASGQADTGTIATLDEALDKASEAAMASGGGGLIQVAAVPQLRAALEKASGKVLGQRNPFGRHAGLRISKKTYDRQKAYRFKKNYGRWMPHLVVWDGTLRLIAGEARIRRGFKPGFVLDDNVLGLTARTDRGTAVIYLHPDKFAQVVRAHRERPLAIAAYLHGIACHELTHLDSGRLHANGHDERWITAREDLGAATGHLLPAMAMLVAKVLRLPEPETHQKKQMEKLEKDLVVAKATMKEVREKLAASMADGDRLRKQLATLESGMETIDPVRLLDATASVLRQRPPAGVEPAYIDGFLARNRSTLITLVRGAFTL